MGVIVVVLPKLENAKKVKKILLEHGFQTVFACSSASAALQMVGEYSYGLVGLRGDSVTSRRGDFIPDHACQSL